MGGDVFDGSTRCIAFEGRLLTIGFAGGRIPSIAVNRILLKNISVVGVHWGSYQRRGSPLVDAWMDALFSLYEKGQLRPVVYQHHPRPASPGGQGRRKTGLTSSNHQHVAMREHLVVAPRVRSIWHATFAVGRARDQSRHSGGGQPAVKLDQPVLVVLGPFRPMPEDVDDHRSILVGARRASPSEGRYEGCGRGR